MKSTKMFNIKTFVLSIKGKIKFLYLSIRTNKQTNLTEQKKKKENIFFYQNIF